MLKYSTVFCRPAVNRMSLRRNSTYKRSQLQCNWLCREAMAKLPFWETELWIWIPSSLLAASKRKLFGGNYISFLNRAAQARVPQAVNPLSLVTSLWPTIFIGTRKACHFIVSLPLISYPHSCSLFPAQDPLRYVHNFIKYCQSIWNGCASLHSCPLLPHTLAGTRYFLTLSFFSNLM